MKRLKKCKDVIFDTPERVRSYAISLLARREYSRKELRTRLMDKGVAAEVADAVLDELQSERLQDDARFIESLVRVRVRQGKGPCILYQEAKEHNIAFMLLQAAIEAESPDWCLLASQVLEKRFGGLPETMKEKGQCYRFLMMRGFEKEHIHAAMRGAP